MDDPATVAALKLAEKPSVARLLDFPCKLSDNAPGWGRVMRKVYLVLAGVALCGLAGCAMAPKVDSTPVTSSPLPGMQKYNADVGRDYWVTSNFFRVCEQASSANCAVFLNRRTHFKVDSLVTNHAEGSVGTSDRPYFHIVMDDGRLGFVDADTLPLAATNVDPVAADAECKRKGDPKIGMTAARVAASCWGPPIYVNIKIRAGGKYEQYVYGDDKSVILRNGIVTSISVQRRRPNPEHHALNEL